MADEQIKITIGAMKMASVDRVFADIRKQAGRIGSELGKHFGRAGKGLHGMAAAAAAANEQLKRHGKLAEDASKRAVKGSNEEVREAQRRARELERAQRYVHALKMRQLREEDRTRRQFDRQEESRRRRAEAAARRDLDRFARRTSHRATRFLAPNLPIASVARRGAMELARGIGLDLSPADAIQGSVSAERLATHISNTAIVEGDRRNAQRVAPGALVSEAQGVGAQLGFRPEEVLGALEAYKKRTGDLATAREMLGSLGRIAAATGTALDQLFGTAGELSNQLTDVPPEQRAKVIEDLVKSLAGQGKLGAVELEDLSRYGARIASTAGLYEGNVSDNIKQLGALAQASRAFGGADSAAMAATSVARLATTFKTSARVSAFKNQGIEVLNPETGQLRNPIELIKKALVATKDDPQEFNKLFMNIMGARGAEGLGNQFRQARVAALKSGMGEEGATQQGLAAVDEFMKKMAEAALTEKQIQDNLKEVQKTYEFQVNELNIEFQKAASEFLREFMPALKEAGPAIKAFAKSLGDVATWVVENPKQAIAAGIGIAIARAGIESAFRTAIERAILGAGAQIGAGAGAGMKGALAVGGGVIAAAIAAGIAGIFAGEEFNRNRRGENINENVNNLGKGIERARGATESQGNETESQKLERLQKELGIAQSRQRKLDNLVSEGTRAPFAGVAMMGLPGAAGPVGAANVMSSDAVTGSRDLAKYTQQQRENSEAVKSLKAAIEELTRSIAATGTGEPPGRVPATGP